MISFANILVALDGSAPSEAALDAACSLAHGRHARVTAVSVCEPRAYLHGRHIDWHGDSATRQEAFIVLRHAQETAERTLGLAIDTMVLDGGVVAEIIAHARRIGADTIVVGSHGRGGLERALLGSVAEGLMRASSVPVLVVHRAEAPTRAAALDAAEEFHDAT